MNNANKTVIQGAINSDLKVPNMSSKDKTLHCGLSAGKIG